MALSDILNIFPFICLKTVKVGASYMAGLFNFSPLWLFAILLAFLYRDRQRLQKRVKQQVNMAISLRNDRQIIIDNIDHLPSWVYFPDVERCEWINKILYNIWPNMTKFTENVLKNTVEPKVNEALSAYKKNPNFEFQNISLGSVVPRFSGLKEYNINSRQFENIILDLNLFYCGNSIIYFSLMSVGGGIQNIKLCGWLRIVLKVILDPVLHLSSLPLLGGIEIFFLHKPKVDFEFMGGLNILGIPGLNGMLRKTIDDQISLQMVQPNKITMKMHDVVDSGYWKCPDPEGLVRIHAIEAKDLKTSSSLFGSGIPDPNVMMTFGYQTVCSDFVENSLNPVWNFWANFIIDSSFDEYFLITVNERSENLSLGKVSVDLNMVKEKKLIRSWIQLEDTNSGMIHLEIFYYNLTCNAKDLSKNKLPYLLVVFINSVNILERSLNNQTPNSFVCLTIGESNQFTKPVLSYNPAFEESFSFIISGYPKNSKLKLQLIDKNDKTDLGSATLLLQQVFAANNMEMIDHSFTLMSRTARSVISLSLRLRILNQVM